MSKKTAVAERQIQSLTRANLDLVRDLARVVTVSEVRAAATPAPAPPPPPPAMPYRDTLAALKETSPFLAARYAVEHAASLCQEAAAARAAE
jgi:hypothetical protein